MVLAPGYDAVTLIIQVVPKRSAHCRRSRGRGTIAGTATPSKPRTAAAVVGLWKSCGKDVVGPWW